MGHKKLKGVKYSSEQSEMTTAEYSSYAKARHHSNNKTNTASSNSIKP